ncbi:MAG: universal stress protein [Alphaproteobacteria bacterium]|nr:universal stress protein [Alphaproteobacteria bacterium]
MSIALTVTHLDPCEPEGMALGLAGALGFASNYGSALTALVFPAEVVGEKTATRTEAEIASAEANAAITITTAAERAGVAVDIRTRSSFAHGIGAVLADQMRVADLGLLSVAPEPAIGVRHLIAGALFDSGRPLLLMPQAAPLGTIQRALVAWDATPAAVRALHAALPLLRRAGEVRILSVSDDKEVRPGQSGIAVTHHLARHGIAATFESIERGDKGVFAALTSAAPADLLVMGVVRHHPVHSLVFGSATGDLLQAAPPLPVLAMA